MSTSSKPVRAASRLDGLWTLGLLATPLLLSWALLRPLALPPGGPSLRPLTSDL